MPKLLLADDSVTIQRVIELTFSGEDVQVVAVGDGEEAIARIPTERPDIVLADIGMPKRSGYDVAAFVKGTPALAHIPVLLLAGAFEPVDQARADQVRCDGVLVKPFEPQQVIARVRELVNGAAVRKAQGRRDADVGTPDAGSPTSESGARMPASRPGQPEARVIDSRPVVEIPEPRAAAEPPPGGETGESLDDYFDRLDAAFASLGGGGGAPAQTQVPALDDLSDAEEVPTIDDLLGAVPHQAVPGDVAPAGARISAPPVEPPESKSMMVPAAAPPIERPAAQRAGQADATPPVEPTAAQPAGQADAAPPVDRTDGAPAAESASSVIADVFSALLAAEQGDPQAARHLAGPPVAHRAPDDLVEEVTRRVLERMAPGAVRELVAQIVSEVAERLVREEIARIRGKG